MAYDGKQASISLGARGLYTDRVDSQLPSNALSLAENITVKDGILEKDFGSRRWNSPALPSAIVALSDWWPTKNIQRQMALCQNGVVYKYRQFDTVEEIEPTGGAVAALKASTFTSFFQGGSEETLKPRKIFVLSDRNQIQVITGDGSTRRDITLPAADWSGTNFPFKALLHKQRMVVFINDRLYYSSTTDHEDFTGSPLQLQVYPGESERIIDAFIYKGRLFVLKYPNGLYFVNDLNFDVTKWTVERLNFEFGSASPVSALLVNDDVLIANNYGGLTSLGASDQFGDVKSSDVFYMKQVEKFIRQTLSRDSRENERHTLYYPDKKLAYISYKSLAGNSKDSIIQIYFGVQGPEITHITKDAPNCFGLKKDIDGIQKPLYGSVDGFIYEMDQVNRNVAGVAYNGKFETQHLDFGDGEPLNAERSKDFDFLEIKYSATGDFDLTVSWFVDGVLQDTSTINIKGLSTLGEIQTTTGQTATDTELSTRIPISGSGRRIQFKFNNSIVDQNFKITGLTVYYQLEGHEQNDR